jgi:hypothetical protein
MVWADAEPARKIADATKLENFMMPQWKMTTLSIHGFYIYRNMICVKELALYRK